MSFQSGVTKSARGFAIVTSILLCGATAAWGDVTISTAQTANMSCSGGVCAPTAASATLNVTDLENMLASGAVKVTTTGSGVQAANIDVTAPFAWSATNALTLDAYRSIGIGKTIAVTGAGSLALNTSDGGRSGKLLFGPGGHITFADVASKLLINGAHFKLENSLQGLATAIDKKPGGNFALASDYDARADGTYSTTPISTNLAGEFEGLGNAIQHLRIEDDSDVKVGLFGGTSYGSAIRDFVLSDAIISSHVTNQTASVTGGLVAENGGKVEHALVTGKIRVINPSSIQAMVGGSVGENTGTVSESSIGASIEIEGGAIAGALAGTNTGTVSTSSASGTIEGAADGAGETDSLGGLVGNNEGYILQSSASGEVRVRLRDGKVLQYAYLGGLSGENAGWIYQSHSTGAVIGPAKGFMRVLGGLTSVNTALISVSYATGTVEDPAGNQSGGLVAENTGGKIMNCYATGDIDVSGEFSGGLVGQNQANSETVASYSTGKVSKGDNEIIGGYAGEDLSIHGIRNSYWDTSTSRRRNGTGNRGNEPGLKGLTTTKFQSGLPHGLNPKIWAESANINNGLPYLIANPPPQ